MSETIPTPDNHKEKFPSIDKVLEGFDLFLHGAEITNTISKVEDEYGLFVLDVEAKLLNGDAVACCFKRARVRESDGIFVPSRIHTAIYDADGIPSSIGPQYDFRDGEWIEIK